MRACVASFALSSQIKKSHFAVQGRASAPSFTRNSQIEKDPLRRPNAGVAFSWSRGVLRKYKEKVNSKRRRLLLKSRFASQIQRKINSKRRRLLLESRFASQIQRKINSKRRRLLLESRFASQIQRRSQLQEAAPPLGVAVCLANTKDKYRRRV